ncbi:TetR/AcrR family transcriptional regulator [Hyphobacterium sp.]|uniref:TetR/AcrR family transcriptional regulator n=1 Tax=Hyphobacterium sp. TaxID=2004662 RepID=UPI003B5264D8
MPRRRATEPILSAACDCLIAGDGDFEMSDVARRAGVSEGLAYHYFKSKAGLLAAVVERFFRDYYAVANARYPGDTPWPERERARLEAIIGFLYTDPLAPVIYGQMSRSVAVAAAEQEGHAELVQLATLNVEDGQKRGFLPDAVDPQIAGAAIIGAVREVFSQTMRQTPHPDPAWLSNRMWDFIAAAVGLNSS